MFNHQWLMKFIAIYAIINMLNGLNSKVMYGAGAV